MKSEDIKQWLIEEFIDYDDYSYIDDDDIDSDQLESDIKYVERYLNTTYHNTCSIDLSVKDGYYYRDYASIIE